VSVAKSQFDMKLAHGIGLFKYLLPEFQKTDIDTIYLTLMFDEPVKSLWPRAKLTY
jgi:hypothetical protein